MNIKDDLLKDAIAEAKAVRETAMANAKLAITEVFAPKIQSMLSSAIQNEDDSFGEEEDIFGGDAGGDFPVDETNGAPVSNSPIADPIANEVAPTPAPAPEVGGMGQETDEFSLENIIRELEQEASMADGINEMNFGEEEEKEEELEEQASSTEFGTADNKKPAAGASTSKTEDPQNSIKANYPKAKEGGAHELHESEEDINLEQLIRELKEEYSEIEEETNESEVKELEESLNEHREVIKFLRARLNEVNLLNSKLLFTNLLLKNHNLNESQKYKVVETLDRATTIKESKLVYSTLEEAFNSVKAQKSSTAKRIVESLASSNVGSTKPSEETQKTILNEGTELARRFQKLAGIKTKK